MNWLHALGRYTHILMGTLGLLAGALAMMLRKGSPAHARVGHVFFVSMVLMATTGTVMSIVPEVDRLNIAGGSLTLYLTITAWITVERRPGSTGRAEWALAAAGLAAALLLFAFARHAAAIPAQSAAAPFFAAFGGILTLGVIGDARVLRRGGLEGRARTLRHLWRMCAAMLLATLSLFMGQPQVFPAALRERGLLAVPPALVAAALLYFLIRERAATPRRMRAR